MILSLRRAHRWIWLALALLLPALYGAALWLRPGRPVMERLPPILEKQGLAPLAQPETP